MSSHAQLCFLFTIFAIFTLASLTEDYYWRDYSGTIPKDAIIGGQFMGHNIYIGQAPIRDPMGVYVVQIEPGIKEVAAAILGAQRTDKAVKILCGLQDNFEWVPTNISSLHNTLRDKQPVIGGYQHDFGDLYVGKVESKDGARIGKVNAFEVESKFWGVEEHSEKSYSEYKILCYKASEWPKCIGATREEM